MITVSTRRGKEIAIISQSELRDPRVAGRRIRAFCHIHGSDHQRSLSIDRSSGWGRCFNAACQARVLVAEWNPEAAQELLSGSATRVHADLLPRLNVPITVAMPGEPLSCATSVPAPWQEAELAALHTHEKEMQSALQHSSRGQAYLRERGISLELALAHGVGLLTSAVITAQQRAGQRGLLQRWQDRLIFPLVSPGERGYIGRSLWGWHPGMDEYQHKRLLAHSRRAQRWIKTNPAGWFSCDLQRLAPRIILVEGPFDRLTLLAAGFRAEEVVALAGTTATVAWLPSQVRSIVLALDADPGGRAASQRLCRLFQEAGLDASCYLMAEDGEGKDWNERSRRSGPRSIWPLQKLFAKPH